MTCRTTTCTNEARYTSGYCGVCDVVKDAGGALGERRVRLSREVRGDFPFGSFVAQPGDYRAVVNKHGAVCIVLPDGDLLGVKPDEFEWLPLNVGVDARPFMGAPKAAIAVPDQVAPLIVLQPLPHAYPAGVPYRRRRPCWHQKAISLESSLRAEFATRGASLVQVYRHGPYRIEVLFLYGDGYWTLGTQAPAPNDVNWTRQEDLDDWLFGDLVDEKLAPWIGDREEQAFRKEQLFKDASR